MRGVRSTFSTSASSHTTAAARSGGRRPRRVVGQRARQEVDAEVEARAGADQILDLGIGLGARHLDVELDQHELGHRQPERPRQLPGHDLGRQRLRPLAGAAELHDVQAVVVRLHQPRQRAALAQGGHVAGRGHRAQHGWHDGAPMPTLLWEPPAEMVERAVMTRYMREHGHDDLRRALALVGRRPRGLLGVDLGVLRGRGRLRAGAGARRTMPGAEWFPGAQVSYPEHLFRGKDPDAVAIVHASELREQAEMTWGELREQVARIAGGLRALGVERGDRVAAYMPNIPEAVAALPGHRVDRRGVVELLAGLRRPLGDRPLRPDRAEGAAGGRRLPLQRPRLRPPRHRRRDRRRGRRAARAARLPRRLRLGGRLRAARRADLRARAVRPPALGAVLVRHHRACRRRSSRARAGSCSSTSRSCTCTSTPRPATGSSGSPRRAG